MMDYAVKELGYTHASSDRRIQAARMLKQFPEIQGKIQDGALSLSNINQAAGLFKNQNIKELEKKRRILKKLTKHALENITKIKFKTRPTEQNPTSRYITNQTKREVYEKSQGVCENCGSLFMLQFDYIEAFSMGGKTEAGNLRLLCFHCNQRARIRTYNQDPA